MNEDTMDITQEEPAQEGNPVENPEETQGEEQGESPDNKPAKNDYSLFDFIKENGSVLFGCGTACVTVAIASLRVASYFYHLAFFRYWGIEPALVSEQENFLLERSGLSFLLIISIFIYIVGLTWLYNKKRIAKGQINVLTRKINIQKERCNQEKEALHEFDKSSNEHADWVADDKRKSLKEKCDRAEKRLSELNTIVQEEKKVRRKYTLLIWVFSLVFLIFCIMGFVRVFDGLLSASIVALVFVFFLCIPVKLNTRKDDTETETDSFITSCAQSNKIPDFWIGFFIIITLLGSSGYTIYEYYDGEIDAKSKKSFHTTYSQGALCAVIASDSDYLYAKEIKISGDTAIIYLDNVFIIPKEKELLLESITFEKPPVLQMKGAAP